MFCLLQISTQNKELKRQSKMLLDLQGPNPPDITKMNFDLDEKEDSMEEYREEQTQKIQSMSIVHSSSAYAVLLFTLNQPVAHKILWNRFKIYADQCSWLTEFLFIPGDKRWWIVSLFNNIS